MKTGLSLALTVLIVLLCAAAKAAVPDADFVLYLYRRTLARPDSAITSAELSATQTRLASGTTRSQLWQEFLNSAEFGLQGFARRNEGLVSDPTYQRFVLDYRPAQTTAVRSWMKY